MLYLSLIDFSDIACDSRLQSSQEGGRVIRFHGWLEEGKGIYTFMLYGENLSAFAKLLDEYGNTFVLFVEMG